MAGSRARGALAALIVAAASFAGALTASLVPVGREPAPAPSPTSPPSSTSSPAGDEPSPPQFRWEPDLVEEFDRLDPTVWTVRDQTANANEDSFLQAANVSVRDGVLRITGRREEAGGRRFTSGYLDTNGSYALPPFFRAEVRAKVPWEQGMWAAPLWLRPSDGSGGEIDLAETYGSEQARPVLHQTIHSDYGPQHRKDPRPTDFAALGDPEGSAWHVYTVEKTPGRLRMWVDGEPTATWGSGDPPWFDRYYEAGKHWNLRVNLQIGGSWGGLPDGSTRWGEGTTLFVDSIRTWRLVDAG